MHHKQILLCLCTLLAGSIILLQPKQQTSFAIAPHYMIAPKTVDQFYQTLHQQSSGDIQSIVIITPNHRQTGGPGYNTLCDATDKPLCFKQGCAPLGAISKTRADTHHTCAQESINDAFDLLQSQDTHWTTREHGLGEHLPYIQRYFSGATVYPIVIPAYEQTTAQALLRKLTRKQFPGNTLYLASVDFSHFIAEDFAHLHDRTALYTLTAGESRADYEKLEVDCQGCLFVLNTLAQQHKRYPQLQTRDSSASLFGLTEPTSNTSRLFVSYADTPQEENGLTLAVFGDAIYDRQVRERLSTTADLLTHFERLRPLPAERANDVHKTLQGIDMVMRNMESPVVSTTDQCPPQDQRPHLSFCSTSKLAAVLQSLGFTHANTANNHMRDRGHTGREQTWQELWDTDIMGFGTYHTDDMSDTIHAHGTTRGLSYVRIGYDFTIRTQDLAYALQDIQQASKEFDYVLVSVHRGFEYQTTPNPFQQSAARAMIEAGADLIVGHHPPRPTAYRVLPSQAYYL